MSSPHPTRGQLERTLSQRILALYREQLGHQPSKVSCFILDQKLAVIIEDSITQPEQLLVTLGEEELVEQIRSGLDKALEPYMRELIEEVVKVPVVDLLSDVTLETGRSGTIAILAEAPRLRDASSQSKPKRTLAAS